MASEGMLLSAFISTRGSIGGYNTENCQEIESVDKEFTKNTDMLQKFIY